MLYFASLPFLCIVLKFCLVVLLLRGHMTLVFALAGQLAGHEHLRWRQFGICRLTVHMDCRVVYISLEVGLQRICLG